MNFNRAAVTATLIKALRQGTSPRELAFTCSLGILIGIFPIWGVTTILCLVLSLVFRLNLVVIQLVNYLVVPLQLTFMVPFIRGGSWLLGQRAFAYNLDELLVLFREAPIVLLQEAGLALLLGVVCWAMIAVPLFLVIYYPMLLAFGKLRNRRQELKSQ